MQLYVKQWQDGGQTLNSKQQNYHKGNIHEEIAMDYLEKNGCRILECNYRLRTGEIDLIIEDGEYLVFVEVKYRKDDRMGAPTEAVGVAKQKQICRTSDHYRMKNGISEFRPMRFDVVSICGKEITWLKNAFEYRRK